MSAARMMRGVVLRLALRGQIKWHTALRLMNTLDATPRPRTDNPRAWHFRQAGRNHR